jgi:hypothetical protein
MSAPKKTARVGARIPKSLRKRVNEGIRGTGQKEASFVRAALAEFFINHPTAEAQISAISQSRIPGAA